MPDAPYLYFHNTKSNERPPKNWRRAEILNEIVALDAAIDAIERAAPTVPLPVGGSVPIGMLACSVSLLSLRRCRQRLWRRAVR